MPIHLARPIKSASFSFSAPPEGGDSAPQPAGPVEIEKDFAFMPMVFDAESGLWHMGGSGRCMGAGGGNTPSAEFGQH